MARVAIALLLLASACARPNAQDTLRSVRGHMVAGDYDAALAALRRGRRAGHFAARDGLAYCLEVGTLLYLRRDYGASAALLQRCRQRVGHRYAATGGATAAAERGAGYERGLIGLLSAFSHLGLGNFERARVELDKRRRRGDAFAHWLIGLLHETDGKYEAARAAYKGAWDVYRGTWSKRYGLAAPAQVAEDLGRVALLAGDRRTADKIGAGKTSRAALARGLGEVVVFHLVGQRPTRAEQTVVCVFASPQKFRCSAAPGGQSLRRTPIEDVPKGWKTVKLAVEQLIVNDSAKAQAPAQVVVGHARAPTQPMFPLGRIAEHMLRERVARTFETMVKRAIARTDQRAAAVRDVQQLVDITSSTHGLHRARTFSALPARIDVGRVWVAPGLHEVQIELSDGRRMHLPRVRVQKGKRVFISVRTLRGDATSR